MKYTVVDIETNGLKPEEGAEITEIAGINVDEKGNVITTFSSLSKIDGNITDYIYNLTGINNEMVKNAPKLSTVLLKFLYILDIEKDTNIVIHNVDFDYNFILYYAKKCIPDNFVKKFEECNLICSLELARKVLPNQSHKLEYLKKQFNIGGASHRALVDTMVTNKVYRKLLEIEKNLS